MIKKKLYGLKKYFLDFNKLFDTNNKLPKVLMLTGKKGTRKIYINTSFNELYF